mmetsp:Transcript_17487/g.25851  ORF Transcript_17487/g.25851 Transcript_17487/m.25851 type:complete len:502 (-) Transcript_17487:154-1659(-)|eukprot:CAMPEP_0194220784 /NCGR_PEP_ID=MMETSP0156-20130528/29212_1 /TAXON_ID=33649 /ORGANISM="Thalassionema nitzschioides, Strain L26-B" /LENGTH=501 /DNA_ID=CAMNT_0038950969 /DNA_START=114 /DNA_END=1619 /DNA_ORIENTATION=-
MAFLFSACGASESFISSLSSSSSPKESSNTTINSLTKEDTTKTERAPPNTPDRSVGTATTIATNGTTSSTMATNDSLHSAVEIQENRLYYAAYKKGPPNVGQELTRNGKPLYFFSIDSELLYWNFFLDFGPLNLGQLYRFCRRLDNLLAEKPSHTICYYSAADHAKRANASFLICAWQILFLHRTPEEALRGFQNADHGSNTSFQKNASSPPLVSNSLTTIPLKPFHDASPCICTYDLGVMDCLKGLVKARAHGFFDFNAFNVAEYEHFEQVENGDLNWIINDRILAFAGPHYHRNFSKEGYCTLTPNDYIPYFKRHNVSLVIRLNKKCYDERDFTNAKIRHFEQYYLDGSCPPLHILQNVLKEMESVPLNESMAIHCKAGLGRTGTCIGAFLIKHYKFTAAEAIGWMRICRPGMVIGPQQHFLQDLEQQLLQEGSMMSIPDDRLTSSPKTKIHVVVTPDRKGKQTKHNSSKTVGPSIPHFVVTPDPGQADQLLSRRNERR